MEEYKKPEFIYVDAKYEEEVDNGFGEQKLLFALNELHRARFPWGLRLLSLAGSVIAGFLTALLLFGTVFWLGVALITGFQFRGPFDRAWKLAKRLTVITLGLLVAVFSPTLGFGLILLYFIITGTELSEAIVDKVMGQFHADN